MMAVLLLKAWMARKSRWSRVGRFGAELPDEAGVFGAEDGAVGAGGPGDAAADVDDAAEVGGGVGVLQLPLGVCEWRSYYQQREDEQWAGHRRGVEGEHTPGG